MKVVRSIKFDVASEHGRTNLQGKHNGGEKVKRLLSNIVFQLQGEFSVKTILVPKTRSTSTLQTTSHFSC